MMKADKLLLVGAVACIAVAVGGLLVSLFWESTPSGEQVSGQEPLSQQPTSRQTEPSGSSRPGGPWARLKKGESLSHQSGVVGTPVRIKWAKKRPPDQSRKQSGGDGKTKSTGFVSHPKRPVGAAGGVVPHGTIPGRRKKNK